MTILEIPSFGGTAPIVDSRRLPATGAQVARNVRFDAGDISAASGLDDIDPDAIIIGGSLLSTGNVGRTFYTSSPAGADYLFTFRGDAGIRAVRNPTPGDQFWRVYYTEQSNGFLYQIPQANIEERKRLGVLPPSSMPVVSVSSGITEKAIESITLAKPIVVRTTVDHGLSTGDIVKLKVPEAAGTKELDGSTYPTKTFSVNRKDDREVELVATDGTNYTAFVAEQGATIIRVISTEDYESRVYVYTYVNRFGEESAPSPVSEVIDVVRDSDVVEVKCTFVPELLYEPIQTIRVYRLVSGESDVFLFAGDFIPDLAHREAGTDFYVYNDETLSIALAEALQSQTWTPPVQNMKGLAVAPNGYLVAFKDNELFFSEPYQPHAWPEEYKKALDVEIVGIEFYGSTMVIATKGAPYVAIGTDPSSVTTVKLERDATCVNALGMTSTGDGVVYPAYDGLVHASQAGARNLTEALLSEKQWRAIYPLITCACFHDSTIYMFTNTGEHYAIDMASGGALCTFAIGPVSSASFYAGTADPVITLAGEALPYVFGGGASLGAEWKSKCFEYATPVNWSCGRIMADFNPVKEGGPTVPEGSITLTLMPVDQTAPNKVGADESSDPADGAVVIVVKSTDVFRLPALEASRSWTLRLAFSEGAGRVQGVKLASSMSAMRGSDPE